MDQKRTLPGGVRARLDDIVAQAEAEAKRPDLLALPRSLPERPKPRTRPTRPKTHAESFQDLDGWLEEAQAGMPDEALARAANVSVTAVLEWRKARKLKRKKGWERKREVEIWSVDAFGDGYTPDLQAVASSRLKGQWDLPEYVLRLALDYDELCRSVFFLHHELGTAPDAIAKALGLRTRDVEMAIAVQAAFLTQVGHACTACGRVCDPAYGDTCSTRCRSDKK